ncbi:uncharacterized protein LOC113520434 isoform X2 [Galleria mellonella]|nr:uncharacterized protein LOC113520434 isoform X2 [Galleria mellonella]XP_031770612.2 uncharacterized protein LOC113520434 isoform X2 [Galleria mellonella]XP_052753978.1 uncharacterized protein LOC113520434 isoform X2 [Galleria mellonella]
MENKKPAPATQQPQTQQHLMAHHVHPDQIYSSQHTQLTANLTSAQTGQIQPNGVMHQLLQSQYHSNMNARSPLLENRHELYGTGHNQDYARHYGANDNYNYPQSPPRQERTDMHTDHNVNHELLHNIPKGYNAEVYQDYLKRNPPKDANQIYQNHQPMYKPNVNQYGSKPYLPYSNRIGPQSNTELLRRQYNEIQQMKMQQQLHYQNQAQMHQQQKFAERQLLLQQIHGVHPPPNLQNSIYSSDSFFRDLDRYSKNDFKDYSSPDIQKDIEMYSKSNEIEKQQNRQYQESQWQANQPSDFRENEKFRRQSEGDKGMTQSPPSEYNNQHERSNVGVVSPMKSSESSTPSIKSPSSESRRSSSGNQALRSPIAQRIPSAPVTMSGILYKQGSDGLKVWRKRWFVLSEYCLFYYKSQDEEKLLGSVLLPSYKVSACSSDDKVLRKFSFKLEHANMRTYVLAAPDQEAMLKWVKALTMAALMQNPNEQPQKQTERAAAKIEDGDEVPGPTYANAPPKPRRSNEGYNSPSPDMYDPNYDILKKPASHYSQSTSHIRSQDHTNYTSSPNQESTYTRSPQSPPSAQQQPQYQMKRPYDTQHLSLPLTNTVTDRLENNQPSTSSTYRSNPQSPYFNNRDRSQQQPSTVKENIQGQLYDTQRNIQRNPFLQDNTPQTENQVREIDVQNKNNRSVSESNRLQSNFNESYAEVRSNLKQNNDTGAYNRDVYGELNVRQNRAPGINDRLLNERRTPDAYGRSTSMAAYNREKVGDYEDVYGVYATENEYGKTYNKSPSNTSQINAIGSYTTKQSQEFSGNEKTFSGPSVLRRKKMQSSGIQPPMPRPHSADFLEYESKNEMLNKTMPARTTCEQIKQPQRPKSSLDINSYYDPSSDRYYSEESYAEKMRQSAQYLQQGLGSRNIQIPLAKYASGLAEKQLNSPYSQITNNNYETEFGANKIARDNVSYNSKHSDLEGLNSNWTLKEKGIENQKDYVNRSGSVMSDGSNVSGYTKDISKFDVSSEGFIRSASARLPSTTTEKDGDKKTQQREESMKRLLEWKQRMLQSPLTRKSTPATISLARSLNQSRQSLRSDQYKSKNYTNASYNSYSSDDEEETSGTDLQNSRDMQAGRSHRVNLTSFNDMKPITPHAPCTGKVNNSDNNKKVPESNEKTTENTYENIVSTQPSTKVDNDKDNVYTNCSNNEENRSQKNESLEIDQSGYETHESEAESETQIEYTDNDLDEVLLGTDVDVQSSNDKNLGSTTENEKDNIKNQITNIVESVTPPTIHSGEDHYLPMSPRKTSAIELAHEMIIKNLSVFDESMPVSYEDNPYVEMNLGNEEEDMQTYEIVCVNSGKVEPVYMELSSVTSNEGETEDCKQTTKSSFDTVSNFADTKDHTLKRAVKCDKISKRSDCSDTTDDEGSKDISLDTPFNRLSISDTFRPASYYLRGSRSMLVRKDSSDSEILPPPPIPDTTPPCEDLSDEALSKYILDKLDKSDISQDNSILKMLTSENQKMNKNKNVSLMIYGSRTSIHDTLTRGEKIRNSRASLNTDRMKVNDTSSKLLSHSILEHYNSSSIETDSLQSYNADRGSSRLSLESDISSKFEIIPSNLSSEVASLNESESAIDLRHSSRYQDIEMMLKRRPLSDDSIFELVGSNEPVSNNESTGIVDLDRYLEHLQHKPSENSLSTNENSQSNISLSQNNSTYKDNILRASNLSIITHARSSSTPVGHSSKTNTFDNTISTQRRKVDEYLISCYAGSQSSGITKSPLSYYSKDYVEEELLTKNLNNDVLADKIKEFENQKLALKSENETNTSLISTGFHSRDSSTEHSAPYYYSDLSSQEHINILPTSHYLKNTNLHRRLNNQRRRGPLHKKNEISHIHNPIRNNQILTYERSYDLAASARSVSVEFLSAADKDPEIDMKNIYESSDGRNSKIPESMSLMSVLGCKRNSGNHSNTETSSPDSNVGNRNGLNTSTSIKVSTASMSSHCSGTSSNTVYYDAEAETSAYENITCQGEKHWDEDALWRDNLRRVSHRHARSMDDLDTVPTETSLLGQISGDLSGMNSIKRVRKNVLNKISRNVTYVNCDIQSQVLRRRDKNPNFHSTCFEEDEKVDDNDVYVSLAENTENTLEHSDEGIYEQLSIEARSQNSGIENVCDIRKNKKRFEIDREKLRQWDLMSSGLMKRATGGVQGAGAGMGVGDAICNTDTGTDSASNEGIL